MGGVKWERNPCVRARDKEVHFPNVECSYPPKEVPTLKQESSIATCKEQKLNSQLMREDVLL